MNEPRISTQLRRLVVERANRCCEYCRSQAAFATQSFSVEHIVPRSRGGASTEDNLALSCPGCNGHKYDKTTATDPASKRDVPLYHPRLQRWPEHFDWDADHTLIIGLTATGRATVASLQMNRDCLINLRTVLVATQNHPPKSSWR